MSSIVPYDDALAILKAANLGFPIAEPNLDFPQPQPPSTWLYFTVLGGVGERMEFEGGQWDENGQVHIIIVLPSGEGDRQGRVLGKTIANLFRPLGVSPAGVIYRGVQMGSAELPEGYDGNWYPYGVSIEYSWQDTG